MKTKLAAFALLLVAGAAPQAFAQDHDHGHDQRPADAARPQHVERNGGDHGWRPQQAVQAPPAAPQAHQAPMAQPPRQNFGGRWGGNPQGQPQVQQQQPPQGRWQGRPQGQDPRHAQGQPGYEDGRRFVRRPGTWVDHDGDSNPQGLAPADRADQEDRDELRQARRFSGDRAVQGDPRRFDGRGPQGGWNGQRGQDPRAGDGRGNWNGDRRGGDGRGTWSGDHRGDTHGRPQWRPGAYPHVYPSQHRFHVREYRRPPHFFFRTWGFGDILPPAWYGPEYVLVDWWDYDLPAPPYGYEWVRVGDDALLIDGYSGRVEQVVRELFW